MKYLQLFENYFNILNHFTTAENALLILLSNKLLGVEGLNPNIHSKDILVPVISFTRYNNHPFVKIYEKDICFVFDKNKLETKYKIMPFKGRKQAEERIYSNITYVDKYIVSILITKDKYEKLKLNSEMNLLLNHPKLKIIENY